MKILPLSEISEFIGRGIAPSYTDSDSGTLVVSQKCIRNGDLELSVARKTNEEKKRVPDMKVLKVGDIVINSTGTGTVGRVAYIAAIDDRSTVDSHVTIVRPDPSKNVWPPYLGQVLRSSESQLEAMAVGGTNQVELSRVDIGKFSIPLPSISDQKKVAHILEQTDKAILQASVIIESAEKLKQALSQDLFKTDQMVSLGDYAEVSTGSTPTTARKDYMIGSNPYIKTTSITGDAITAATLFLSDEAVQASRLKKYQPGTILLAMYGQGKTRGNAAILRIEASITQNAAAIEVYDTLNPDYLWHYLRSQYENLRGEGVKGHISHLNLSHVKKLMIPLLSYTQQEQVAKVLGLVDDKIILMRGIKDRYKQLKIGLSQDLVSGEIKV